MFGAGSITVGSDYPFDMGDPDPVRSALLAGLQTETLSANALRWLGMSADFRSLKQPVHSSIATHHFEGNS